MYVLKTFFFLLDEFNYACNGLIKWAKSSRCINISSNAPSHNYNC